MCWVYGCMGAMCECVFAGCMRWMYGCMAGFHAGFFVGWGGKQSITIIHVGNRVCEVHCLQVGLGMLPQEILKATGGKTGV